MFIKFPSKNCAVYEIMWKQCGTVRKATDDSIIPCMRIV
jgi:hypothetical protein